MGAIFACGKSDFLPFSIIFFFRNGRPEVEKYLGKKSNNTEYAVRIITETPRTPQPKTKK